MNEQVHCPDKWLSMRLNHFSIHSFKQNMDKLPQDVLIHCIAPFFVFEASVDPTHSATHGYQLLQLCKWTPAQSATLKRNMHHVFTIPGVYREFSNSGVEYETILEESKTATTWLIRDKMPEWKTWLATWIPSWIWSPASNPWRVSSCRDLHMHETRELDLPNRRWSTHYSSNVYAFRRGPRGFGKTY